MSESKLVESISSGAAAIVSTALIHYRELLNYGEASSKKQRESLAMAAHVLGKSTEQVAADHEVMTTARDLAQRASQAAELEHQAGVRAYELEQKIHEVMLEKKRLDLVVEQLGKVSAAAESQAVQARHAAHDLAKLKDENPELLGE